MTESDGFPIADEPLDLGLTRHGLVYVRAVSAEEGGGLLAVCECRTETHLLVDMVMVPPGRVTEAAFTCDGCGTAHWFTAEPEVAP